MINQRVKAVRNALNLTQKEFGHKLAVAQNYLSNIESGHRDVTEKIIRIICLEFNVNETWLRTGEGEMFQKSDDSILAALVAEYKLDDYETRILQAFLRLPEEYRRKAGEFLCAFADAVQEGKTKSFDDFSKSETVRVFRAAKSENNADSQIVDMPRSTIEKLEAAKEAEEI